MLRSSCTGWITFYLSIVTICAESFHTRNLADGSPVKGRLIDTVDNEQVLEFLGIPFAEPPIGNLRFRKTVPKKPWTNEFEAFYKPKACIQTPDNYFDNFKGASMWNPNTETSEDCLYLNVWAPYSSTARSRPLPVLIWIYGGGFWSGSAALDVYDAKILSTTEQVVVVSMNYRVTAFGFLYAGPDTDVSGNAGLFDQLEALKWVRANILAFGGDPEDVTLFGESAGAASVSLHILSPLSKPYFRRAIMMSSTAISPWALETRHSLMNRVLLLSEAIKCNVTVRDPAPDMQKAVDCLRSKDAEEIKSYEWITNEFCDFPWTPVVDGHFLTDDPIALLERGQVNDVDILLGNVLDESMYFIIYHVADIFTKQKFFSTDQFVTSDELFRKATKELLPRAFSQNSLVYEAVIHEYTDYSIPPTAQKRQKALDRMLGDYHFTCPTTRFAQLMQSVGANVYMYYFVHRSSKLSWPEWMGVLHGYEIPFVFGEPLNSSLGYTAEEVELSRRVMRYWSNFARTGDPNRNSDDTQATGETWPIYIAAQEAYLTIGASSVFPTVGNGIRRKQCAFWNNYLPQLLSATKDISDIEIHWKQQFDLWQNSYIRDWQYMLERYSRMQERHYHSTRGDACSREEL